MQGLRKHIGTLLLLLFVSYYGGITLFRHVHQWGESTIVHSHPHSKNCEHSHTAAEFQFIQQISAFLSIAAVALSLFLGRFDRLIQVFRARTMSRPVVILMDANALRGPPALTGIFC